MISLKISEVKEPISLEVDELLAKTLFESVEKRDIFAHLFLVLDFCLMKGVGNCVNSKINHIHFHSDSLIFEFAKSKGHQKGENNLGLWNVYATPSKMWSFPVLSLSRY